MSAPVGRWWHAPALRGMARGTGNAALAPSDGDALLKRGWTTTETVIAQVALDLLQHTALPPDVVAEAATAAADPMASHDRRMRAVRILAMAGRGRPTAAGPCAKRAPRSATLGAAEPAPNGRYSRRAHRVRKVANAHAPRQRSGAQHLSRPGPGGVARGGA